ncbi:hypothetical protein LLG95_05280 [bacterium]|nr:hypothetical protein [bacterium]
MSITIDSYAFEGPFLFDETWRIKNASGVYAILTLEVEKRYKLLDIGESENVRERVENHDRIDCWKRNNKQGLYVAVYYCNEQDRMIIEAQLRAIFNPVCGVR